MRDLGDVSSSGVPFLSLVAPSDFMPSSIVSCFSAFSVKAASHRVSESTYMFEMVSAKKSSSGPASQKPPGLRRSALDMS